MEALLSRKALRAPGRMLVLVIALGSTAAAAGNVWHVPGDFDTIQEAMDTAASGDTVLVGPATYEENISYGGKAISLRSTAGPEATVIRPTSGRAVDIAGPGAELVGFTITNGQATRGAGVQTSGDGSLIEGCIFEDNHQGVGGSGAAIAGNVSSPIIRRNVFRSNTADSQFLSGVVAFINCSSPIIENNIFEDNPCRAINLFLPSCAEPLVINNTIVRNDLGVAGGEALYRNNIIVDNGIGAAGSFPVFENNLVYGNDTNYDGTDLTGLNGNLSQDPLFADPLGDYQLTLGSPAIDTGSPIDAPLVDFLGEIRPLDGDGDSLAEFDMGAFEYVPEPAALSLLAFGALAAIRRRR